jgi:phosphosulfolactate synthase (CoM biosynthesis protein A)
MYVNMVRFDGQTFFLDEGQDVAETKRQIVAAVREGSDFVDFVTIGHGTISLLVTPSVPVRFEVIERSEEQLERLHSHPPPIDQSWFDHEL